MKISQQYNKGLPVKNIINSANQKSVNHNLLCGSENNINNKTKSPLRGQTSSFREKSIHKKLGLQIKATNDFNSLYKYKLDSDVSHYLKEFINGRLRLDYFFNKDDQQSSFLAYLVNSTCSEIKKIENLHLNLCKMLD